MALISRRMDGGGYVGELCFFLTLIGSVLVSIFAILKPRPRRSREDG
jgi:hypothetical protein